MMFRKHVDEKFYLKSALAKFEVLFMPVVEKHAPLRMFTVKNVRTLWLDRELKEHMAERNQAKLIASKSGSKSDWQVYCKLRNFVTGLTRKKRNYIMKRRLKMQKNVKKVIEFINGLNGQKEKETCLSI